MSMGVSHEFIRRVLYGLITHTLLLNYCPISLITYFLPLNNSTTQLLLYSTTLHTTFLSLNAYLLSSMRFSFLSMRISLLLMLFLSLNNSTTQLLIYLTTLYTTFLYADETYIDEKEAYIYIKEIHT